MPWVGLAWVDSVTHPEIQPAQPRNPKQGLVAGWGGGFNKWYSRENQAYGVQLEEEEVRAL